MSHTQHIIAASTQGLQLAQAQASHLGEAIVGNGFYKSTDSSESQYIDLDRYYNGDYYHIVGDNGTTVPKRLITDLDKNHGHDVLKSMLDTRTDDGGYRFAVFRDNDRNTYIFDSETGSTYSVDIQYSNMWWHFASFVVAPTSVHETVHLTLVKPDGNEIHTSDGATYMVTQHKGSDVYELHKEELN